MLAIAAIYLITFPYRFYKKKKNQNKPINQNHNSNNNNKTTKEKDLSLHPNGINISVLDSLSPEKSVLMVKQNESLRIKNLGNWSS